MKGIVYMAREPKETKGLNFSPKIASKKRHRPFVFEPIFIHQNRKK